jgi:hypothetical protein
VTPRMLTALATADFRDRVRRPAFLMAALATVALGYLAAPPASAGYTMVKVGAFRGVYDSGYLGTVLSLAGALWLSLCGFYVVKSAITRDTTTGVGQILAAAPMRTAAYLIGKFLSNLMVLAAMAGVLALTALGMLLLRGESSTIDLVALWLPFLLLCLPVLAVSAAAAVLFESLPALRGGAGNIVWCFGFLIAFVAGLGSTGLSAVGATLQADLLAQHPQVRSTEISVGLTMEEGGLGTFHWSGLDVTGGLAAGQLGWLGLAVLVAALPAAWFTRFDPARQRRPARRSGGGADAREALGLELDGDGGAAMPSVAGAGSIAGAGAPAMTDSMVGAFARAALPRGRVQRGRPVLGLVAGELRLLFKGLSRWWWLGLLGITAAGLAVPAGSGGMVLLLAWIWPVLLWSRLGTQAIEHGVHVLTGTGPSPRQRLLGEWAAGVVVAALAGAGPLLRMLLGGDVPGSAAWLGGAVFIPTLAILLGTLSRSARLFQLVYLMLWYTVVNGLPVTDFMGALRDGDRLAGPGPLLVLAVGGILLAVAVLAQGVRHARR